MVSSSGVVLLIEAAIGVPGGKPQDLGEINGSSPVLMAYSDGSSERREGLLGGQRLPVSLLWSSGAKCWACLVPHGVCLVPHGAGVSQ